MPILLFIYMYIIVLFINYVHNFLFLYSLHVELYIQIHALKIETRTHVDISNQ